MDDIEETLYRELEARMGELHIVQRAANERLQQDIVRLLVLFASVDFVAQQETKRTAQRRELLTTLFQRLHRELVDQLAYMESLRTFGSYVHETLVDVGLREAGASATEAYLTTMSHGVCEDSVAFLRKARTGAPRRVLADIASTSKSFAEDFVKGVTKEDKA